MPEVLEQPRLLHPTFSALPTTTGVALIALTGILKAPADQPNLPTVINNALRCLQAMQARAPHATGALAHLTTELSVAAQSLAGACELDQPGGMMGRISEHRAWALCSLNFDKAPLALLECIGFEIGRAYLTQDVFLRGPAADL